MKRIAILLMSIILLSVCGCSSDDIGDTSIKIPYLANGPYFDGTVVDVSDGGFLIEPFEEDEARKCSDRIYAGVDNADNFKTGDEVRVHFDGTFAETYPATASGVTGVYLLSDISVEISGDVGSLSYDWQSAYVNYSGDYELFFAGLNREKMYESKELHLPVYKFDDREKLMDFRENFKGELTFDHGYDEIPSFDDAVLKYDEEYFNENSLFVVYVQASSGSLRFGVSEVYCDGTNFRISVSQLNSPEVVTCDMAGWFIFVETGRSDIDRCTEFDAVMR